MERSHQIIKTSVIGILANFLLVGVKTLIGFTTGSIAVLMDAVNNLSDALSSVITIVGTKLAGKLPDKKHPYGYGRVEYITSITIAVIVLLAGITSFTESIRRIFHPVQAEYTIYSLVMIAFAVIVKWFLGRYVKNKGVIYNSESLIASGADAIFDAVLSFSTLVAAGVSLIFHVSVEGYLGVMIAVVIVKAGIEILIENLGSIIGKRVDSGLVEKLKTKIQSYPMVEGVYDLILHQYGPEQYIGSVHIQLDDEVNAKEIHKLSRDIMADIYINFGIVLTIGIYASNTDTNEFAKIKEEIDMILRKHPEVIQMHGFYMESDVHTISFDLVLDYKVVDQVEVREQIIREMKMKYPEYTYFITLDQNYSS